MLTRAKLPPGSGFGRSIALSGDGRTAVIGNVRSGKTGTDLVYVAGTRGWSNRSKPNAVLAAGGGIGSSSAINAKGSAVVAEDAPSGPCSYARQLTPTSRCGAGTLDIFLRKGTTWKGSVRPVAVLLPTIKHGLGISSSFASTVGMDEAGGHAFGADQGFTYLFRQPQTGWHGHFAPNIRVAAPGNTQSNLAPLAALSGDGRTVLSGVIRTGIIAYLYRKPAAGWSSSARPHAMLQSPHRAGGSAALSVDRHGLRALAGGLNSLSVVLYRLR